VLITLSGCISIKSGKKDPAGPLGVFKSIDNGATWAHIVTLMNAEGQPLTIGGLSIEKIVIDPSDFNALYLITSTGLFFSADAGQTWVAVPQFANAPINDIAIDYFDKCNIFVASGQSIYRSTDCLRNWKEVYFDKTRPDLQITDIETDHYNKDFLYAGNSKGEILKSSDFGKTWQQIKVFKNPVKQLLIDKFDSRVVYAATESAGIYKSVNGGQIWSDEEPQVNINNELTKFRNWNGFYSLIQDPTQPDTFIWASKFGLLKTTNAGLTWEEINLITPTGDAKIYAVAIDPQDSNKIYYATDGTLYITDDGGQTWATQAAPTIEMIKQILIQPDDASIMYIASKALPR
ncbi:WD40/YVTN/BNR-like repeat-containing protein, partial [Patescibacteria group bacterium]